MILEKFNLKNIINQRITFKDFFSNTNVSSVDERRIRKSINAIYLKSILNQKTTNIRKYEDDNYIYSEIFLFEVILDDKNNIRQVEDILHETFPNPIIIIFKYNEEYRLSTAIKRLSKITSNTTVIEGLSFTSFFKIDEHFIDEYVGKLNINKTSSTNLKELYEHYYIWNKLFNIIELFNEIPDINKSKDNIYLLDKLEDTEGKIKSLTEQKSRQRQVADKMRLHQKIAKERKIKTEILNEIKEKI